jgi:hypothetical protein
MTAASPVATLQVRGRDKVMEPYRVLRRDRLGGLIHEYTSDAARGEGRATGPGRPGTEGECGERNSSLLIT